MRRGSVSAKNKELREVYRKGKAKIERLLTASTEVDSNEMPFESEVTSTTVERNFIQHTRYFSRGSESHKAFEKKSRDSESIILWGKLKSAIEECGVKG